MFTIEHEDTYTVITTLDRSGLYTDVEVILDETDVVLRQFNDESRSYDLINLSHQQFTDIYAAMNRPEGSYYTESKS